MQHDDTHHRRIFNNDFKALRSHTPSRSLRHLINSPNVPAIAIQTRFLHVVLTVHYIFSFIKNCEYSSTGSVIEWVEDIFRPDNHSDRGEQYISTQERNIQQKIYSS